MPQRASNERTSEGEKLEVPARRHVSTPAEEELKVREDFWGKAGE